MRPVRDYAPLSRRPRKAFVLHWSSFVEAVLSITVEAYKAMCNSTVTLVGEENLTAKFVFDYLKPKALEYNLLVVPHGREHTRQIIEGEELAKKAKEFDIKMFGVWDKYDERCFVWECKLVSDKRVDQAHEALSSEYVKEGIFRFIDEEYSAAVDDAGMLGFVLQGDIDYIVLDINRSMQEPKRARKLSPTDHLHRAAPIGTFSDIYYSVHQRPMCKRLIRLHHLFLIFNFAQKPTFS